MPRALWIVGLLAGVAFALGAREDRRTPRAVAYEQIGSADRRAVADREQRAAAAEAADDRHERQRKFERDIDALYAHRRGNPGTAFDGLELGEFPSEQDLERHTGQSLVLDDDGRLVTMRAWVSPPGLWDIEGSIPPEYERACALLEQRLIAVWGEPVDGAWLDPATRMRATVPWPCEIEFERY